MLSHKDIVERALKLANPSYSDRPSSVANVSTQFANTYCEHLRLQAETLGVARKSIYLRERWAKFTKDMYFGNQLPYLDKMEREDNDKWINRRGKITVPLTSMIIDLSSNLYDMKVIRYAENTADVEQGEHFISWTKDNMVDGLLKEAEPILKLLGNGAILMAYDDLFQDIIPSWISADNIRVVENPRDLANPLAVVVRWEAEDVDGGVVCVATIYTEEEIIPYFDGKPDEDLIAKAVEAGFTKSEYGYANPYRIKINGQEKGVIPLVLGRLKRNFDESWFCEGKGQSLASFNVEINNKLTTIANQVYMQGFTPVIAVNYDPEKDSAPPWGPNAMIKFTIQPNQQAGIQTVPLDSHITENFEDVKNTIALRMMTEKIPESFLNATSDASGVSIVAASAPLMEMREESKLVWKPMEQEMFRIWAVIDAFHNNKEAVEWENLKLVIDWADVADVYAPNREWQLDKEKMEIGIISKIDLVLKFRGDLFMFLDSVEERRTAAFEYLAKIAAENKAIDAILGMQETEEDPQDKELLKPDEDPEKEKAMETGKDKLRKKNNGNRIEKKDSDSSKDE